MLKCAYYLFSSSAGFCQVDAARKGRNGQDNWMGEKKKKKNQEKKKAINWLTCVHVTNTSPHVVKSHYLFERLFQTLRCLFFLDSFFFSLFHFLKTTAGFLLTFVVCFTFNGRGFWNLLNIFRFSITICFFCCCCGLGLQSLSTWCFHIQSFVLRFEKWPIWRVERRKRFGKRLKPETWDNIRQARSIVPVY